MDEARDSIGIFVRWTHHYPCFYSTYRDTHQDILWFIDALSVLGHRSSPIKGTSNNSKRDREAQEGELHERTKAAGNEKNQAERLAAVERPEQAARLSLSP